MKIVNSYFVQLENGMTAWLAVGKSTENAKILEERPMLMPDFGMVLKHKDTGEISYGHWLRDGDNAEMWEEIPEPKEGE